MRLLLPVLLVTLSGCSLFGADPEPLEFETLVQADTLVASLVTHGDHTFRFVLLQSEADEAEFRAEQGAGPFPLAVDYGRHSVVGYITESGAEGGRVTIESATWDGELIEFTYSAEGVAAVAQGEEPAGYPAHVVLIRRIEEELRGASARLVD